jgi:nucleoside-specific outer membrane channel protein Tsx
VEGLHCLRAHDAHTFADAVVRAYHDRDAWQRMSKAVLEKVDGFSSDAVGASVVRLLRNVTSSG